MTLEDLQAHVWRRLGVRKFLAGRDNVNDMVTLAVANWDDELLNACIDDEQRDVVCEHIVTNIKRGHQAVSGHEPQEYGFIWVLLLQALASLVVQLVLRWWLQSATNRVLLIGWRNELTSVQP